MDFLNFESGNFRKQHAGKKSVYLAFIPNKINHEWIWGNAKINIFLEKATKAITRLNTLASTLPNLDTYINMYISKESQTSNKIEGTQTTFDESLMKKELSVFYKPTRTA